MIPESSLWDPGTFPEIWIQKRRGIIVSERFVGFWSGSGDRTGFIQVFWKGQGPSYKMRPEQVLFGRYGPKRDANHSLLLEFRDHAVTHICREEGGWGEPAEGGQEGIAL